MNPKLGDAINELAKRHMREIEDKVALALGRCALQNKGGVVVTHHPISDGGLTATVEVVPEADFLTVVHVQEF